MIASLWVAVALAGEPAVVEDLATIQSFPGTSAWDREVAFYLLVSFDLNHSGAIDRRREVNAIPCEVLTHLDTALAEHSEYPGLLATYWDREDLVWLGGYLGFHERVRARAGERMHACGLTTAGTDPVEVDGDIGEVVAGVIAGYPDPGSPEWGMRTGMVLVLTYDDDESAAIDLPSELRSIPCIVWQVIDARLREAGQDGLVWTFGMHPDLPWSGERLGITSDLSRDAWATAQRCGLPLR